MNAEGGATMGGDCCEELPMYAVNKKNQKYNHEFHGKVYQFETSKRICIKVKIKKMK